MFHHISFGVSNIQRASAFYDAALVTLVYARIWEDLESGQADQAVGYGIFAGGINFRSNSAHEDSTRLVPVFHSAFAAKNREAVVDFYKAAIGHGG